MVKFNGKDLEQEFGLTALGRGTYGAPERDIEQIHVPGRNGDLLFDNGGFKNINVTYPCSITENQPANSFALRNFLLASPGYRRLEDDYDTDHYRLAEYRGPYDPDVFTERRNKAANFDLVFNCKPQRFRKADADYMGAPIISGNTLTLYVGLGREDVTVVFTFSTIPSTYTIKGSTYIDSSTATDISADCVVDRQKETITYTGPCRYLELSVSSIYMSYLQYIDVTDKGLTRRYRRSYSFPYTGTRYGATVTNTGTFPAAPDLRIITSGTLTAGDVITISYYTTYYDVQTIKITFGATATGGGQIDIFGESTAVFMDFDTPYVTCEVSGALKAIAAGAVAVIQVNATTAQAVRLGLAVSPNAWDI